MKVFVYINGKWQVMFTNSETLANLMEHCASKMGYKVNIDRIGNQMGGWYEKYSGRRVYY